MTVESTIGTGQDYETPSLWEAAVPDDATEAYKGTAMVDQQFAGQWTADMSNASNVDHEMTAALAVRHGFNYSGVRITGSATGSRITLNTTRFILSNWAVDTTGGGHAINIVAVSSSNLLFRNVYSQSRLSVGRAVNIGGWGTSQNVVFEACAFVSVATGGPVNLLGPTYGSSSSGQWSLHNCSGFTPKTHSLLWTNFGAADRPTIEVINCKFFAASATNGAYYDDGGSFTASSDYNVSDGTDAPGANSIGSEAASDHFASVTDGAEDLSIKSTLNKAAFIGTNQLAGQADVEGDFFAVGACDMGCDAESVGVAAGFLKRRLGLGLGLGM